MTDVATVTVRVACSEARRYQWPESDPKSALPLGSDEPASPPQSLPDYRTRGHRRRADHPRNQQALNRELKFEPVSREEMKRELEKLCERDDMTNTQPAMAAAQAR